MNNAEFVKWVKSLTPEELKTAGCKSPSTVKAVCLVLATYGDYATGERVKMAWTTIAKEAAVSRTTAHKVRDWLVNNKVLEETGKTEKNITVYRLATVDHLTWTTESDSADGQLSTSDDQLSNLDGQLSILGKQLSTLDGHNTNLDTTKNITDTTDAPVSASASTDPSDIPKFKLRKMEVDKKFGDIIKAQKWTPFSNINEEGMSEQGSVNASTGEAVPPEPRKPKTLEERIKAKEAASLQFVDALGW